MQHSQEELLCSDFLKCKMRWEGRVLYTWLMWKTFCTLGLENMWSYKQNQEYSKKLIFGAARRDKVSKLFSPWASCLVNRTLYHNIWLLIVVEFANGLFSIEICPLSVVGVVSNYKYFRLPLKDHFINLSQTWHKTSLREGNSNLFE